MSNADLYNKLDQIAKGDILAQFLKENGTECWKRIVDTAPKETGRYAASIQMTEVERNGNELSITIFTDLDSGWNGVPLAEFLEHGTGIFREDGSGRQTPWVYYNERWQRFVFTRGQKPQPHWSPAYFTQIAKIKEGLKHVFD